VDSFRSGLQQDEQRSESGKSHQPQLVDSFIPSARKGPLKFYHKWCLSDRSGMKHPPTAVGGIPRILVSRLCRLGMKHPPTAVGGIPRILVSRLCRLGMKHPPTAVGGISES
jgi:hypothetical protein